MLFRMSSEIHQQYMSNSRIAGKLVSVVTCVIYVNHSTYRDITHTLVTGSNTNTADGVAVGLRPDEYLASSAYSNNTTLLPNCPYAHCGNNNVLR